MSRFWGPWDEIIGKLNDAWSWLNKPADEALQELAKEVERELRKRMRSSPKPRLDDETIERKKRAGMPFPQRSWWAWGKLIKAPLNVEIKARRMWQSSLSLHFTEAPHLGGSGGPITNAKLVDYLEYGTHRMPPRPVLGPLTQELPSLKMFKEWQKKAAQRCKVSF